jgi:hypothetical protein
MDIDVVASANAAKLEAEGFDKTLKIGEPHVRDGSPSERANSLRRFIGRP